jgi:alginate O-acetyltransferase complex protein AlgJ
MLKDSRCAHVYLDLVEPFRTAFDKDRLYFRTDSHWSGEGCYFAYRLLCERIGIGPAPDLLSRSHQSIDGVLDMGSKFDPPIYEPVKFYDFRMKTRRVFRNAIARYLETPEFGAQIRKARLTGLRWLRPGSINSGTGTAFVNSFCRGSR